MHLFMTILMLIISLPLPALSDNGTNLIIRKLSDLSFGSFAILQGGGEIIIDNQIGNCQSFNQILLISHRCNYAVYEITGTPNARVMISLPTTIAFIGPGGAYLSLRQFTINSDLIVTLSGSGKYRFNLGATLRAQTGATPTNYTGLFPVNVSYVP